MNASSPSGKAHPFLKKPVIFIQRVPAAVNQQDLIELFRKFYAADDATVTLTKASVKRAKAGEQVARVDFSSVDSAQKAMALLQHQVLPKSSSSISFALKEKSLPLKLRPVVLPRLFKYRSLELNASEVYDILRRYGPIFSLTVDEEHETVSVKFWKAEDAQEAVQSLDQSKKVGEAGTKLWPMCDDGSQSSSATQVETDPMLENESESPQVARGTSDTSTIPITENVIPEPLGPAAASTSAAAPDSAPPSSTQDPSRQPGCRVFCTFLPLHMDVAGIRDLFSKFGYITRYLYRIILALVIYYVVGFSAMIRNNRNGYSQGVISFSNREDGLHAINAMNGALVGRKKIAVRLDRKDGKTNGAEHTNPEKQFRAEDPLPPSGDLETHDQEASPVSLAEPDIHGRPNSAEPDLYPDTTTISQSSSEATLTDSPNIASAEDFPSEQRYSTVTQADLPSPSSNPNLHSDYVKTSKTSSSAAGTTLDHDTAQTLANFLTNAWKDEADRLKTQLDDLRARENSILEELNALRERERDRESRVAEGLAKVSEKDEELMREVERLKWENECLDTENLRLQNQLARKSELEEQERVTAKAAQKEIKRLHAEVAACKKAEQLAKEREEGLSERLKEFEQRDKETKKKVAELEREVRLSESRSKVLELELDRVKSEEARKQREKTEKEREARETNRLNREQEKEERRKQNERRMKEEEERKRKERDQRRRESEEKARTEKAWREATAKEIERCRTRDRKWTWAWSRDFALARFKAVMDEFESQKFSTSCPMVLLAIPWPVLVNPSILKLDQIQWDAVEKFFDAIREMMTFSDYKALVDRAHKMFHPDHWRSRNVLSSVMDTEERRSFETAGNTVSQAITPIWRNLRR
ncbi:hypothetical protein D9758_009492 [Tetrapyrgos nigripes]|uniref:RRM domain-containing protein n=1 Tax=Tetrapyrgos nigripes TaxID=182062 RepID=A0A8H5G1A1_9AGAR|nr:hypothetical protein D9758_009492 [Tetrapyrgos nigripes]